MLTTKEAKKIGIQACIEKLGVDLCRQCAENGTSGYGVDGNIVHCFVAFNDTPAPDYDISKVTSLILTHEKNWKYSAACEVDKVTGEVLFVDSNR